MDGSHNPEPSLSRVSIELDADEALVLFDWLASAQADSVPTEPSEPAQAVLASIEAQLEQRLVAPFDPRYRELLNVASDRVRRAWRGESPPAAS